MSETAHEHDPAAVGSVYPPLLLMALSGFILIWSYQYGPVARFLPVIISTATFFLSILDLVTRIRGRVAGFLRLVLGAGFQDVEMKHSPPLREELVQSTWVVACLAGMLVIGILPAIPLFVFSYMYFQCRQEALPSLVTAIVAVAAIAGLFELLLGYDLYRGLLFGGRGLG